MNYKRIHDEIITNAILQCRDKTDQYYEEHHIIPKCLSGSNDIDNLVLLTYREHFIIHWLLTKIHNSNKLVYAFNSFNRDPSRNGRITSKSYKYAREKFIQMLKESTEWKDKISKTNSKKIWIKNNGKCKRIESNKIDQYISNGWQFGRIITKRKPHSKEAIINMKTAKRHKPIITPELRKKYASGSKGKRWINNGSKVLAVPENKINEFLDKGWKLGSNIKRRWINNSIQSKFINELDLDSFLKNGWILGRI